MEIEHSYYRQITNKFDVSSIGLFAPRISKHVITYTCISYYRDSQAVAIDDFTIPWYFNLYYKYLLLLIKLVKY